MASKNSAAIAKGTNIAKAMYGAVKNAVKGGYLKGNG